MRRFPNIFCAVSFLVAAFTTVASGNSDDYLDGYKKCDYKFIMTEIVVDKDNQGSFIEIYSPNCANKIVTDDFQLIRYGEGTGKAKSDVTNLKSMKIDPCGFIVLCFSSEANKLYDQDKCNYITGYQSPADSELKDSIAIIEGNIDRDYTIIDAFGNFIVDGEGPIKKKDQNRAVRRSIRGDQTYAYKEKNWLIGSPENIDPGKWWDIGLKCHNS